MKFFTIAELCRSKITGNVFCHFPKKDRFIGMFRMTGQ